MGNIALSIGDAAIGYRNGKSVTPVVTAINATLRAGEVVALIGTNGAGKSTLLRTLSAFQPPLSGKVEFPAGDIAKLSPGELAKSVSIVLTENNFATLTVRELVSLGRTPYTNFLGHLTGADKAIVVVADALVADTWIEDSSIALTYMHLMATELGLGSCWVQIHLRFKDGRDSEELVRDILKIDDHYRIVGIMALGHSDDIPPAHDLADIDKTKIHFLV